MSRLCEQTLENGEPCSKEATHQEIWYPGEEDIDMWLCEEHREID